MTHNSQYHNNIPKILFTTQGKLDSYIADKKNLNNRDVIMNRILAALVELGEFTNEWREFKFWSSNQESNTVAIDVDKIDMKKLAKGDILDLTPYIENPMLEEYVDVLHFILSIGNHINMSNIEIDLESDFLKANTSATILQVYSDISGIAPKIEANDISQDTKDKYEILFNRYIQLGIHDLGYPLNEIVDAYFAKNNINFNRQNNGY